MNYNYQILIIQMI